MSPEHGFGGLCDGKHSTGATSAERGCVAAPGGDARSGWEADLGSLLKDLSSALRSYVFLPNRDRALALPTGPAVAWTEDCAARALDELCARHFEERSVSGEP